MKKGFTLIELLIVVAIIAILAAIAVPNFLEAQTRAKVSRVKSDLRTYATAIESYAVDNNRPPRESNNHLLPGDTVYDPSKATNDACLRYHLAGCFRRRSHTSPRRACTMCSRTRT